MKNEKSTWEDVYKKIVPDLQKRKYINPETEGRNIKRFSLLEESTIEYSYQSISLK